MRMLPFDIAKAIAGANVVTRHGRKVRFSFFRFGEAEFSLYGAVEGEISRYWWTVAGCVQLEVLNGRQTMADFDLFIAQEPIVRWVNFYGAHDSHPLADHFATQREADSEIRMLTTRAGRETPCKRLYGRAIRVEIDTEVAE